MLLQADAAALEIRVAAYLSQDQVLINEIINGVDLHTDNQIKFGLPSRLIAKVLNFRILYGGNEYSFANDPDFTPISKSKAYWKDVVDAYYDKYKGIAKWHTKIIKEVIETNKLIAPTGREYYFQKFGGQYKDTQIKNYAVQGTGADLMALARVSAFNRLNKLGYGDKCLLVNTVHDSIILDYDDKVCDTKVLVDMFHSIFVDLPLNFEKMFKTPFNVPMAAECQVGMDWKNMEVYK
ncbi:DNA-directed DNA polymerase, family A, palm domain containing protein [uncultured Caudovirales phage]|uniref:DNA-directed DNA polymerase, family A, palm domain containing protein n=1 Tax=uncultured Caudovirales phage TaxID=2100421 RepID=A0A6J5T9S5_9CAUD|nr:DNA-directed DNA polymerase, family A, palm domain containing protein [uncultured Caudovirales phage]